MEKYLKYGILGIKHGQECYKYCNEENRCNDYLFGNKYRKKHMLLFVQT
jgi:hypothetical protein